MSARSKTDSAARTSQIVLRPDQANLLEGVRRAFQGGVRSVLMQAMTGFGKTTVVSQYAAELVAEGKRVLFVAHLDTILEDTIERLEACGIRVGTIWAGHHEDAEAPVQVASIQTLLARGVRPDVDVIIRDEAHRILSPAERRFFAGYQDVLLLGLTPAAQRGDGQPLGNQFQHLECGPQPRWMTERGLVVPCDVIAPMAFQENALAMDPVAAYQQVTPGQRTIVFASNVAHAYDLTERFRAAGAATECVIGDTAREVRRAVRARMTAGELRVLVGVGVFVEGFDLPAIETVILARSFSVTVSYLQAIGRGLRTSPSTGKTRCTVIDLRGSVHLHGLPDEDRVWSLTGAACRRTETLPALRRCPECLAIYRPQSRCPRCGAGSERAPELPRVLTRGERLENLSALPQHERDRRYIAQLERIARQRIRLSDPAAARWALRRFEKQFGREPERRTP